MYKPSVFFQPFILFLFLEQVSKANALSIFLLLLPFHQVLCTKSCSLNGWFQSHKLNPIYDFEYIYTHIYKNMYL